MITLYQGLEVSVGDVRLGEGSGSGCERSDCGRDSRVWPSDSLMVARLFSKDRNLGQGGAYPWDTLVACWGGKCKVLSFRKAWRSWFRVIQVIQGH